MGLRVEDRFRVLIIDEDAEARNLIASTLGPEPYFDVVGEARDGVAGVRLAVELDADLVVFDPSSSDGDGSAVLRELLTSTPNLAVVVHTESATSQTASRDPDRLQRVRKGQPMSEIVDALKSVAARHSGRNDLSTRGESYELQRHAFESMSQGVVVQDQAGRIVFANSAAQQILESTTAELAGSTSMDPRWDAVHPDGSPWPGKEHPATEALRTQAPVRDVLMGVRIASDARCWMSVTATPLRNDAGAHIGVVITFADVTEHQQANDAQLQAHDRVRSAVDHMPDGFIILVAVRENDQVVDFECEFLNATAETIAGYHPEELIGKRLLDIVPDLAANDAFPRYVEAIETGDPIMMDVPWLNGPRTKGLFEVRGVRVGDRLALTFRNIMEQRLAEGATHGQSMPKPNPRIGRDPDSSAKLSARELEVLALLESGASTGDIADQLFLSVNTVRNHIQRSIAKLGAHSRLEAVAIARRSGMLPGT